MSHLIFTPYLTITKRNIGHGIIFLLFRYTLAGHEQTL